MTTIVTRAGKGSPLTNNEVDSNFTNLNTDKIETLTSTDTSVTITGTGSSRDLSVPVNPNVVSGPASATDNAVARFDTTTGKLIQNSVVTIDDAGVVAGASISGASNTLSNIGNSALTNSAITINGNATALGGSVSVGTVTSVGITAGTGVTSSGGPITSSGSITVGLSTKLTAIENLSGAGFITQNGSGAISGRTIQAGTGISVAHGNGASQDPVITNTAPDQTVALTAGTGISTSGTYPNFTIAATNNGTVTSVTGTAPVVSSGGATPAISMAAASTSVSGYLTSTDWNTFNNKTSNTGTVTSVATGTGLTGGPITGTGTVSLANTAVTPGSYTYSSITVDAQGRITSASSGAAPSAFPSGTLMLFQQTSAPTGWTKSTTHNNKALRVVSGTASSGGTTAFTSVFTNQTVSTSISVSVSGTSGATTLSTAQMPSHTHSYTASNSNNSSAMRGDGVYQANYPLNSGVYGAGTGGAGSNGSHTHSFSGSGSGSGTSSAVTLNVQYVDLIIASKN